MSIATHVSRVDLAWRSCHRPEPCLPKPSLDRNPRSTKYAYGGRPQEPVLNLIRLEVKRGEVAGKTLSPRYLRELEHYAAPGGYFSFFDAVSIYELRYGVFEDWITWLGARKLSPKTQSNALGDFRNFVGWLKRRG